MGYGLGVWLDALPGAVELHGFDTGAAYRSVRDPAGAFTVTLLSNQTAGTWPASERVLALVTPDR